MNQMNTIKLEQDTTANNPGVLKRFVKILGFATIWVFISALIVGCIAAAIWTVIPTELLEWGAGVVNRMGYISHCSFAPISTLILLISAVVGIAIALRIHSERRLGKFVFGGATGGLILGILIEFDIIMFIGMGVGLGIGLIFGLIIELFSFHRQDQEVRM